VMTGCPDTVHEDTSIDTAITLMRCGPYRRLPVVDGPGRLVGLLTLDDVLEYLSEELSDVGRLVKDESPASLIDMP
jgi:CBS domain-containing protein